MLGWLRRLVGRSPQPTVVAPAPPAPVDDDPEPDEPDSEGDYTQVDEVVPAITDELDLHTFQPKDCASVVDEYLRAAREAGLVHVRVVHGKGKGVLRRIVHGVLEKHPDVASFQLADGKSGSWGATLVQLKPRC